MKRFGKVIAVAAALAVSCSCIVAYAAEKPEKGGAKMPFKAEVVSGQKANFGGHGRMGQRAEWTGEEADATTAKERISNIIDSIKERVNTEDAEGRKFERPQLTEEEIAAMAENRRGGIGAKFEEGQIPAEIQEKIAAAAESGEVGGFAGKAGGRNKGFGMNRAGFFAQHDNSEA